MKIKKIKFIIICFFTIFMLVNNMTISKAASNRKTTVVIKTNLTKSNYLKKVKKAFKNPSIEEIYVYDSSLLKNNNWYTISYNSNTLNQTRIKLTLPPTITPINVKTVSDYIGTNAIAKAEGSPGDYLEISKTKNVSRTVSTTRTDQKTTGTPISKLTISNAVGYSVTSSDQISIKGSCTVPKKHNGKKVKSMSFNAHAIYQVKSFDLQWSNGISRKIIGYGTAKRPYGIKFKRIYKYK